MRSKNPLWSLTAVCLGLFAVNSCGNGKNAHLKPVQDFKVEKYMGVWYEAARYPNPFEKGMSQVTAAYSLRKDGKILVVNQGLYKGRIRKIRGVAKFNSAQKNTGELLVSFFRPFYGPYRIVLLGKDYEYSVVVSPRRNYLWILSRTKVLSPEAKKEILAFMKEKFLPEERLIWDYSSVENKSPVTGKAERSPALSRK